MLTKEGFTKFVNFTTPGTMFFFTERGYMTLSKSEKIIFKESSLYQGIAQTN